MTDSEVSYITSKGNELMGRKGKKQSSAASRSGRTHWPAVILRVRYSAEKKLQDARLGHPRLDRRAEGVESEGRGRSRIGRYE